MQCHKVMIWAIINKIKQNWHLLPNVFGWYSSSLLSFEEVGTPGQTKTGMGPRVYPFIPQTAVLPESDAGSAVIKPASSFVIQNRQTSCSMWCRCTGHAVSTWSAVCSDAPHSQLDEGAKPHLCMDEWNRPTPVRRRLSLTQAARGKPSQQAWHRSRAQKHGAWKHFHSTPFSICDLSIQKRGCQVWQGQWDAGIQ